MLHILIIILRSIRQSMPASDSGTIVLSSDELIPSGSLEL